MISCVCQKVESQLNNHNFFCAKHKSSLNIYASVFVLKADALRLRGFLFEFLDELIYYFVGEGHELMYFLR